MDEINNYKKQLENVEISLSSENISSEEKKELKELKENLIELINLTLQATNENATTSQFDEELSLFMSEIKKLENPSEDSNLEDIKKELKSLIGKKCSAPHNHTWGVTSYHNAIICGLEDCYYNNLNNIENVRIRILFTNPTHKEMVPCSYFLEGECKFNEEKCHFSHGELISFSDIKDYKEPDFSKLKRNCFVLAKLEDKIWHKGRVISLDFANKSCRVRLDVEKKEIDINFEDLFPLCENENEEDVICSSSDSEENLENTDMEEIRKVKLVEQSLFNPVPDQRLGNWEKHTRGIGSKLMEKMGYVVGTGLGSKGEGIIVPVSAQVLPAGRSLDYCMELRENANGDKDLFSVEKRLKKQQKRQEIINQKSYEKSNQNVDVFSFINTTLATSSTERSKSNENKKDLTTIKSKSLNVESVKIHDDIRKKEKEIEKIEESMSRYSQTSDIYKHLKKNLDSKSEELDSFRKYERNLKKEQTFRKNKQKLFEF